MQNATLDNMRGGTALRTLLGVIVVGAVLFVCALSPSRAKSSPQTGECLFDTCLQDSTTGSIIRLNSSTGCYEWTTFISSTAPGRSSFTMNGKGTVLKKGSMVTLQDFSGNHRVLAKVNLEAGRGTAHMQLLSTGVSETITGIRVCGTSFEPFGVIMPLYRRPYGSSSADCATDASLEAVTCEYMGSTISSTGLSKDWQRVIAAHRKHPDVEFWVILNPNNGPNLDPDNLDLPKKEDYEKGICLLKASGIKILGYVFTKYAGQLSNRARNTCRTVASVEFDIDTWISYRQQPDGIFFDEMANEEVILDPRCAEEGPFVTCSSHSCDSTPTGSPDRVGYYSELRDYAHDLGFSFAVGNPGATTKSAFVNTMDTIITYERAFFPAFPGYCSIPPPACDVGSEIKFADLPRDPNTHSPVPKRKWAVLAYNVPAIPEVFDPRFTDVRNHVKYIYATNDTGVDDNPWDEIPCVDYLNRLLCVLEIAPGNVPVCK